MAEQLGDAKEVGEWEEAITAAKKKEEDWRKQARRSVDTFRGDKIASQYFNIHHSNVEIVVPSLYNSTPIPDVRRRFGDDDPVARTVAEVIERALSYCADAYSFDEVQYLATYDMVVAGRGVTRVRYMPDSDGEKISAQRLTTELVPWDRFIRGDASTWRDVPFVAYEHYLPKEEIEKLNPDLVDKIPYNYSSEGCDEEGVNKKVDDETPKQFLRAKVYEIWDKRVRKILFICPEYKEKVIKREDDVLGLDDFFDCARPLYGVCPIGTLVPVNSFSIYGNLLDELNEVSRRIIRLVKQLRPRGGYAGNLPDIKSLTEADDGELIALTATSPDLAQGAVDVNRWIAWFPLEATTLALRELVAQRDALLQTIYQVTGMSDLMRGSNDPRATATAENLKAQFGSVRVRAMQAAVAQHARDTFRLKSEIIAKHFEWDILSEITNIKLLPKDQKQQLMQMAQANPQMAQQVAQQQPELAAMVQAPSIEEVMEVLRSGMVSYRIDIETNSTTQMDSRYRQEQMVQFINGTAQFLGAMGPAVKEGAISREAAIKLYTAFTREFNLMRSAEDALEQLSEQPMQTPGDPAGVAAAKAKGDVEKAKVTADANAQVKMLDIQTKKQIADDDRASEQQIASLEARLKAMELQLKQADLQAKDRRERDQAMMDMVQRRNEMVAQDSRERQFAAQDMAQRREDSIRSDNSAREANRMRDARQGEANRMKSAQVSSKGR